MMIEWSIEEVVCFVAKFYYIFCEGLFHLMCVKINCEKIF